MRMTIAGQWVDASTGVVSVVLNPATGSHLDTVPEASPDDVDRALQAARSASQVMARLPAHRRAEILQRTADLIRDNLDELKTLLASENGKPVAQTEEELKAAARIFQGFGEEAKRLSGSVVPMDAVPGMESHLALTIRQPVGVVVAIVPFNYPAELYAHKGAAALAAGNAVICKPPPQCPLTLLEIARYIEQAGAPAGAHQVVTGGTAVGERLVSSGQADLITATGSVRMGKRVSALAAESLVPVHLELGGNDAMIICDDADIDLAAEAVVLGRLARGNGQICCATKRVFVSEPVHDRFVSALVERVRSLRVGDPLVEGTDVGPLIDENAAARVEETVSAAVTDGAAVAVGGTRRAAFMDPTVLVDVPPDAQVVTEEVFGPVAPVIRFGDIDDAVGLTNSTPYGLQAAVFTRDIRKAFDIAYRLDVGGVVVNWSSAIRVENLPFGGMKQSGHGRESLSETIRSMTRQKSIIAFGALSGAFDV